jgi:4-amino-4-deoxy-L-arabinose transferase-like glycosyltransferase
MPPDTSAPQPRPAGAPALRLAARALDTTRPRLLLVALSLLLWLPGFFVLPPSDRDESRFAQASRQMVETGDYVRLYVGEEERNKKPVGIHWAQAATVHALEAVGLPARDSIWAYRLPGLAGALVAVLATFTLGRALVGPRAALLAGALLAASMVLNVETKIAKTDAALLGAITVAMGLFARAYLAPAAFTARQAATLWLAIGVSILLKGPIGPMVLLFTGITLAAMDRGAPWWRSLRLAWGIPLALAIAAPWLVAIGLATEGRFFAQAIGDDMLGKVAASDERHWAPPGFYLATFGIAAFPAAFLVLLAAPAAWAQRARPATRFLLAWIVPTWLLFEALATKLPHYTLPVWPALMLLAAAWAMDPLRPPPWRGFAWLARAVLLLVPVGLAIGALLVPFLADRRFDAVALLAIPAAALFLWATQAAWRERAWAEAALLAAVLAAPLYAVVLQGVLPRLHAPWVSAHLGEALARVAPGLPPGDFASVGHSEPSLLFATHGATRLLASGAQGAAFLAEAPRRVVAIEARQDAAFRTEAAARGLSVTPLGRVEGFNYTRGRRVALTLYGVR